MTRTHECRWPGCGKRSIILLSDGEPELMYGLVDALCTNVEELLIELAS